MVWVQEYEVWDKRQGHSEKGLGEDQRRQTSPMPASSVTSGTSTHSSSLQTWLKMSSMVTYH